MLTRLNTTTLRGSLLRVSSRCLIVVVSSILLGCGSPESKLVDAVKRDDLKRIQLLLSRGVNVNARDEHGYTALHEAAALRHKQVLILLISNRADVNAKTPGGSTPLAAALNQTVLRPERKPALEEIIEVLIDHGADVNAADGEGATPLHDAIMNGHLKAAEILIAKGADLNARVHTRDRHGWTPLHCAAADGCTQFIPLLIANKADINAKDEDGKTPLHLAKDYGRTEIAEVLRKCAATE